MIKAFSHTYITCDARALTHNFKIFRTLLDKKVKLMCVVKGDAYGHGIERIIPVLKKCHPDFYAVFTIDEAIRVRKCDAKTNILLLQPFSLNFLPYVKKYKLHISVSNLEVLRALCRTKLLTAISVHVCVESGLGRDGFAYEDMNEVMNLLTKNKKIQIAGLYTHFSGVENRVFDVLTSKQVSILKEWQKVCREHKMYPIIHSSGTAGAFFGYHEHMCRIGLGLYGLWPSNDTHVLAKKIKLQPVLRMATLIVEVKSIPKDSGIGYDATYVAPHDMLIAIVPVGYANGLPRTLSNNCDMLVRGVRVPLRGRVMMNMCVLDVTHVVGVKMGDEVVIIGKQGKEEITVDELAFRAGTINYELVTSLRE